MANQQSYNKGDGNPNDWINYAHEMVEKAIQHYIKKFDLPYEANDLTKDERKALVQEIYNEEVEEVKEGEY